uniref:Major facilitator superfamily (MFS) profile domain-containing protein n=1 Tax=Plectus sambesii TaxID=2011161 RepID=A0A914VPZ2_9BILA
MKLSASDLTNNLCSPATTIRPSNDSTPANCGTSNNSSTKWAARGVKWRCEFGGRTRYLVLVVVTLCLTCLWSNILTFNFTLICMVPKDEHDVLAQTVHANSKQENAFNATISKSDLRTDPLISGDTTSTSKIDYSPTEKSILIGAVAVGALLSSMPITLLINQFGARIIFTVVGLMSATATALIPGAAELGLGYFLVLRIVQGAALAACMPMIGTTTARWATIKQHGLFLSILTSFLQLAPCLTMPISGEWCESSYGWPFVYYFHAVACFIIFCMFAFFYRNRPKNHPCVGEAELEKLAVGKTKLAACKETVRQVPYAAIYRTPAVWAVWVAAVGNFSGTLLVTLFAPTYLNKAMGYRVLSTGFSAALPPMCQFVVKVVSGLTSDKVRCFPETLKVRVYNTVAFCGVGFFFIVLAFVPSSEPVMALIGLVCGTSLLGFSTGGFYKSATLVSRHYSQFVMGKVSMVFCVMVLVVSLIVDGVAVNNAMEEWRIVFLIHAGLLIGANLFFCVFGSAKAADWARDAVIDGQNIEWAIGMRSPATVEPIQHPIERVMVY